MEPGPDRSSRRRRPRLTLLLPHLSLGGGERVMMEVAARLADDFQLEVCALDYSTGDSSDDSSDRRALSIRQELQERFQRVSFVSRRWGLRPILARTDIVLWYGVVPLLPRTLAAMDARPVSIRVVHTDRPEDGVAFSRRWGSVIDGTVCVVPEIARQLAGAVFIPNTCSPASLEGRRQDLFPQASGRPSLGFLGRLVPLKNADWLLDHLEELGCNLAFQVLDSSWLTARELVRRAADRGLASRVRFLPPSRQVGTLLRSIDALIIASEREGFPLTVIEAGYLGVPVISTRVGALPELFRDEVLFVDSQDGRPSLPSLRNAVARLRPELGRRLQARVESLCSPAAVTARYRDYLHQIYGANCGERRCKA